MQNEREEHVVDRIGTKGRNYDGNHIVSGLKEEVLPVAWTLAVPLVC